MSAKATNDDTSTLQDRTEVPLSEANRLHCAPGKTYPLQLLDLPLDILKDIVKELTQIEFVNSPQHIREFSLGNGHAKWIDVYAIDKESGKMLGTLVAVALERMTNLETFIWDMPTGILRDCWLKLGTLKKGNNRALQKVWVRFHDNSEIIATVSAAHMDLSMIDTSDSSQTQWHNAIKDQPGSNRLLWSYGNVEWPNFSVLPALRSLNVVDIDELAYLEEMSKLVSRSIESLRELRIGFAVDVPRKGFTSSRIFGLAADAPEILTYKGALGLVFSKIDASNQDGRSTTTEMPEGGGRKTPPASESTTPKDKDVSNGCQTHQKYGPAVPPLPIGFAEKCQAKPIQCSPGNVEPTLHEPKRLRLEVLELERVNIGIPVLVNTVDWSFVTSLTLLSCDSHEKLWKSLRRIYAPRPLAATAPDSTTSSVRRKSKNHAQKVAVSEIDGIPVSEYRLKLRKIHTNTVSPALITFLKETLAPNSLQTLIFQDGGMVELDGTTIRGFYESTVSVDTMCRVLRRHRSSLKQLVIDSNHRTPNGAMRHQEWRKWKCDRGCLSYLTSGKMSALTELSLSLDYKDWHFFLQRLPQIPYVRSIYVTNITDHAHGHHLDMKELALQIMDVVTLRPEIQLCYIGIINKCFEIQEGKYNNDDATISFHSSDDNTGPTSHTGSLDGSDEDESGDEDDEEDDDDDEHDDVDGQHTAGNNGGQHSGDSEDDSLADSETESEGEEKRGREPRMKLREILFYDEKISIFKARHAKL
ncbi:MAG: hypothetical protein Q9168_000513 [Polycauliona sp. 1 TL-2023]